MLRTALVSPLLLAVLLTGCPTSPPPPPPPGDAGPGTDAGPDNVDTDGDGLCDDTEIMWGTDPAAADSDLDGLSDRVERDFGYAPLEPDSPARDLLLFMDEGEGSTAQFPVERVIRGRGETYSGAFEALPVQNRLDYTAQTFLEAAIAVGAVPMENVFEVRPDEQRFVGVFGRTQLVFELRFAFGGATDRGCVTAFPLRYQIKRSDGALVGYGRYLLVLLPPGERLDTASWCVPDGGCI